MTDFRLNVARGTVPGWRALIINGYNPDADMGSVEWVWNIGGEFVFPTAADTVEVVSSSADDDGSPVGDGARTIHIEGVDASFNAIVDEVTMNGTTPVTSPSEFLFVNLLHVETAGTERSNVGIIDATYTTSGLPNQRMDPGAGNSQSCYYCVPTGKQVVVEEFTVAMSRGGGVGDALFQVKVMPANNIIRTGAIIPIELGATPFARQAASGFGIPATTLIWIEALTTTNNTTIFGSIQMLEIDI